MSTLVPTRTTTVTVPCPGWRDDTTECGAPLDVEVEIVGRHIPASRTIPEEWPEVYVVGEPTCCESCGTEFDRVDRDQIREQAEKEAAREFC